ncbi:MAG: hypothetical protein PHS09_02385 [Candidatus Omnitrophica bacterium]|nr:hypothetical protein [Candidatus Omnitrophota bacterium]MDD5513117.1 hypothetical protein [Candidatus Omnitrophota bacterium]
MFKIRKITSVSFRRFGRVIEFAQKRTRCGGGNLFCKVVTETRKVGWRIAYLVVREKTLSRMESHPQSWESFEPVCGRSLLFVSRRKDPGSVECFLLDRPVVLKKGLWHGIITLNGECEVKITENASVDCLYWQLGRPIQAACLKKEGR